MIVRILCRAEWVTDQLAALSMLLTMVAVTVEVAARYLFNSPLSWSNDVLILYLIPGMFFLGLPGSYTRNAHIAVDIIVKRLPQPFEALGALVSRLAGIILFASLVVFGFEQMIVSFRLHEVIPGVHSFPVWPSSALVPLGSGLVLLRMLTQLAHDIV